MARPAGAEAAASTRNNSAAKLTERRSITFYLLRGPTTFQNRGTERNPCAQRALAPRPNLVQLKIELHGGDYLHRASAGRKRPHTPLLDCTNRCIRQRWRALEDLVDLDAAILRGVHLQE